MAQVATQPKTFDPLNPASWSFLFGKIISTQWFQNQWTVTQDFGPTDFGHEPPLGSYAHFHQGIDLAGAGIGGTPVLAGIEAQVIEIGYDAKGFGNFIRLSPTNDPNTVITLGHLADTKGNQNVQLLKGDALHVGDTAGHVGSSGNSTGNHLHFQVNQNGVPVNPVSWLLGTAPGQANAPLAHDSAAQMKAGAPHSLLPGPDFSQLNTLLNFITDPKEWWRIIIVLVGIVLIFIGVTGYFAPRVAKSVPVPI